MSTRNLLHVIAVLLCILCVFAAESLHELASIDNTLRDIKANGIYMNHR